MGFTLGGGAGTATASPHYPVLTRLAVKRTHALQHALQHHEWPIALTPYHGESDLAHLHLWRHRRWTWWLRAHRHPYTYEWFQEAMCIHHYESGDWHEPGSPGGGMQFMEGTWLSAGGGIYASWPAYAQPWQQLIVAYHRWATDGGSWREWSTAPLCGL